MKKFDSKRKGFTLVELLIVIVVIGILSAMMMLSSTEAVTSAKASNIVSNLRNLKTAALACYTDNIDYFTKNNDHVPTQNELIKYLSKGGSDTPPDMDNYYMLYASDSDTNNVWYICCEITGTKAEIKKIQQKLAGRAKSLGLVKGVGKSTSSSGSDSGTGTTNTATTSTAGDSNSTTPGEEAKAKMADTGTTYTNPSDTDKYVAMAAR